MSFEEKTIESKIVYDGPIFKIRKHKVKAVDGRITQRDILEHPGGAAMIAIKDNGNIILVSQFRKALEKDLLELPAGKRDEGEDLKVTAQRELKEETGFSAGNIEYITTLSPSVGYTQEILDIYLCTNLKEGERNLDSTEDIDIREYSPDEAVNMVLSNKIIDAKTALGILFARAIGKI